VSTHDASRILVPDWCELVRGDGPVLLVAPHGGRRPPVDPSAPPANLKVNDVHTAELTRELAARLGATAVINHGCDRNTLDLNRRSQIRRRAPWFLELLRERIAAILAHHACAEILFIHGWNVGQAKCDIGIGARQAAGGLVTPDGAGLTVAQAYIHERIEPLRAALEQLGIETFIGIRYPASHPNNLTQVFSRRPVDAAPDPCEREMSEWSASDRVQAVQLELGVPLRWPGTIRGSLVDVIVGEFTGADRRGPSPRIAAGNGDVRRSLSVSGPGDSRQALSLQFYDPVADIGLLTGIGPIGGDTAAARLLLFVGGQRVVLFTGEQSPLRGLHVEPLRFDSNGGTLSVSFRGPVLKLDDGTTYLDLEAAFVASTLGDIATELTMTRSGVDQNGAEFGHVDGWVDLGDGRRAVSTGGHVNAPSTRSRRGAGLTLTAAFGRGHGLLAAIGRRGATGVEFRDGGVHEVSASLVRHPRDSAEPAVLVNDHELRFTSISRMEILRSLPGGEYIRVHFGTARVCWRDHEGHGIYEYASGV